MTVALRCTEAWSKAALDNRLNDLKDTVENVAEMLKLAQCVVVFEFHGSLFEQFATLTSCEHSQMQQPIRQAEDKAQREDTLGLHQPDNQIVAAHPEECRDNVEQIVDARLVRILGRAKARLDRIRLLVNPFVNSFNTTMKLVAELHNKLTARIGQRWKEALPDSVLADAANSMDVNNGVMQNMGDYIVNLVKLYDQVKAPPDQMLEHTLKMLTGDPNYGKSLQCFAQLHKQFRALDGEWSNEGGFE